MEDKPEEDYSMPLNTKTNTQLSSSYPLAASNIESIDIVQIISGIEEKLEEAGLEGYDLFEKVFEVEEINLKDISDLIIKEIK